MSDTDNPPPIHSLDELLTREQLAERFGLSERTVDGWRWRTTSKSPVTMPYIRFANKVWFWEGAILWWLNHQQERVDPYRIDRMRRVREGKKVGK
jgi:hypothetical protein